ncbi:hypothetical protein FD755_020926 [Muntiacus reevesi]|uniref:Uncharacterized protein n=1 Tax=Muntiacus reevesi TaxID=9886 RepID=A0A5N3X0E4_MUNRE|nr:hypothetical protein FD755_020926 [Muntiacus reevesi]
MPLLENTPKHLMSAVLAAQSLNSVPHGAPAFGSKGECMPREPGAGVCNLMQALHAAPAWTCPGAWFPSRPGPRPAATIAGLAAPFFPPSHPWTPNEILISSALRGI